MSWQDWAVPSPEMVVADARVLHDPKTFSPFIMVRVKVFLPDEEFELSPKDHHIEYAKNLVEEKLK